MNAQRENLGSKVSLLIACLFVALATAWGQQQQVAVSQSGNRDGSVKTSDKRGTATHEPGPSPSAGDDYVIGAEDVLAIAVWREPEISRAVPVRPDGKISLPLVGDLQASGSTPKELQNVVAEQLKAYISNPQVAVIVQEVKSQKFNIVGEVLRPGSYPLASKITVLDAIAIAGGFQEFANVKKMYVLRRMRDGSRVRLPFDYKSVIRGGKPEQNVELMTGDTVVVP